MLSLGCHSNLIRVLPSAFVSCALAVNVIGFLYRATVFYGASAFNGDLNQWDVAKVTNMKESKSKCIVENDLTWRELMLLWLEGSVVGLGWWWWCDVNMVECWCSCGRLSMFEDDVTWLEHALVIQGGSLGVWVGVYNLKNVCLLWAVTVFWSGLFLPPSFLARWLCECNRPSFLAIVFYGATAFNRVLNQWNVANQDLWQSKSIR